LVESEEAGKESAKAGVDSKRFFSLTGARVGVEPRGNGTGVDALERRNASKDVVVGRRRELDLGSSSLRLGRSGPSLLGGGGGGRSVREALVVLAVVSLVAVWRREEREVSTGQRRGREKEGTHPSRRRCGSACSTSGTSGASSRQSACRCSPARHCSRRSERGLAETKPHLPLRRLAAATRNLTARPQRRTRLDRRRDSEERSSDREDGDKGGREHGAGGEKVSRRSVKKE
jgi:hypothetical protein